MIFALLYLQYHSAKNRALARLNRLKQPKYLLGSIVGGLYFYWYFFRTLFGTPVRHRAFMVAASPENLAFYESLGALLLLTIILLAWFIPRQRAALAFTEAEVAFLFPAPVSRRTLIHFKLLRSQVAIFFTTLLLTLVTRRIGGNLLIQAVGWWLILSTVNLHLLGSSFALTMLLDRGITNWQRRLGILAAVLIVAGVVIAWARRAMPDVDLSQLNNFQAAKDYVQQVLTSGPMPWLLYPARLVVRPFLAPTTLAFLTASVPAVLLLLLHYWWVIRSNVAFEEGSVEASRKLAEKIAAVRAGNWRGTRSKQKVKRAPFLLRPLGPQAVALLWKNLISAGQLFTFRLWLLLAALAVGVCMALRPGLNRSSGLSVIAMMSGMLLIWSLILGPQLLRQDLRQDLLLADILKMYPMRGWQIVLGELLAPVTILTGVQWVMLILSLGFLPPSLGDSLGLPFRLGIGFSAAILMPGLNLLTLQIPNAAVLLFPAWFQLGKEGGRGIEATGQRLIFMFGQLLVFAVALIPAAGLFAGVFFLVKMVFGMAIALPLASVAALAVLAAEAALGLLLLGRLFEHLDLSKELSG